ncbi:MAG: hypothetical protein Q9191_004655 [Dirinaria sp. TL-2023a]
MAILQIAEDDNRQLQNVANILASAKKVVLFTGAGISTNCGIPDFRSEEGLYALIQASYDRAPQQSSQSGARANDAIPITSPSRPSVPSNVRGKDLFDSVLWKDPVSTSVFYTFIASLRKKIREEVKQTSPTHRFIRTLRDGRRLVRCYTQNIDGLENREGLCTDFERGNGVRSRFRKKALALPSKLLSQKATGGTQDGGCEVVQLHGDLETLRCTFCKKICGWEEGGREALLLSGRAPECLSCTILDQDRRDRGKRGTKIGTLRPNIVLYGEEHPSADAISTISTHDLGFAPDVLLILGTSLHVHGLKVLVKEFAKSVHARPGGKGKVIFVNLTKPSESVWKDTIDYWVSMDCDQWVGVLKRHRPDLWHIQTELKPQITKVGISKAKSNPIKDAPFCGEDQKENAPTGSWGISKSGKKMASGSPKKKVPLFDMTEGSRTVLSEHSPSQPATKCLKRKRSCENQQLPTPPSSGHRARFLDMAAEPIEPAMSDPRTPSKRTAAEVVIYQDPTPKRRRTDSGRSTDPQSSGQRRVNRPAKSLQGKYVHRQ